MKKLIFAISLIAMLASCKGDKTAKPELSSQTEGNIQKGPAVRDGNVIRQKVTVGGNQNSNIDAATALKMMKVNPEAKILDVRTDAEVAGGIYPNALHLDIRDPEFKTKIGKLDKEDTYIVYCMSGGRSGKAVSMMRGLGFDKSYNMKDGYEELSKASKN